MQRNREGAAAKWQEGRETAWAGLTPGKLNLNSLDIIARAIQLWERQAAEDTGNTEETDPSHTDKITPDPKCQRARENAFRIDANQG
jgi:hypothetical protein